MDERASKPPGLLPLSREDLEKTLRYALEIVSDGIWDWNIATNQVSRSAGWYLMLGYPPHSLPESVETWKNIIHPEDYPRVMASFQAYLDGESPEYCEEYRCRTYSGDYLWISDRGRFVEFDERGEPRRMIGAHHEIHQRKLVELELQQRNEELFDWNLRLEELVAERTEALHRVNQALASKMAEAQRLSEIDPLTELYNRRKFEQCLHHEWMRRQRHGRATALVMIDVDHFKRINDLFGHSTGDRVLVAFGRLADRLERRFNRSRLAGEGDPGVGWRSHGVTAWGLAVLPLTLLAWALAELPYLGWLVQALALYAALGLRSLGEHAEPVALALRAGDLDEARRCVGYLVSRDTRELDQAGVARAATESVLENGSDAVYAALFWFAVAGAPGVVLYRLSNTLDAMWGYRNARFERFGWAAAKIDDILNYLPARLVALTYALLGGTRQALRCWREQAPQWDSPNAGPVMAAGAGALGVSLGGAAIYHGELHQRPLLGSGPQPQGRDIYRALALVRQGVLLWLLVLAGLWAMGWLHA
nr:adenosylcobinamide-phosphate synthase CbiB [Pseudomonas aeruginosa]